MPPVTPEGRRFGPFTIVRLLGRGSFGSVFEVHDPRLDRRAALKVLRAETPADLSHTAAERFTREAEALARLRHPNVVRVHEAGSIDATPYVLMELVEGETLADRLRRGDAPRERLLAMVVQVARGLHAAHAVGVVHRDVKPQNVVVDAALTTARVIDFGVALLPGLSSLTSTGGLVGTPAYVAPEALRGEELGPTADVHALGATLFEVLTGRLPYAGQSFLERYGSGGQVGDVRALDPTIPAPVAQVCARALDADPARRWPDAGAFGDALEAAAAGAPPGRAAALAALALAVAALAGLAVALAGGREEQAPRVDPPAAVPSAAAIVSATVPPALAPVVALPPVPWRLAAGVVVEPVAGRHHGPVTCAGVSSGGLARAVVVTGGGDGAVRVWRARDGAPLLSRALEPVRRGRPKVSAVAVRADGQEVVAMAGRTVRLRVSDGAELAAWPVAAEARGGPFELAISSDGAVVLALSEGSASVLVAGRPPARLPAEDPTLAVALSADGQTAALAHDDAVSTWDVRRLALLERRALDVRAAPVAVTWAPDGGLAVLYRSGKAVELAPGGAQRVVPPAGAGSASIAHLGSRLLVAGRSDHVRTYEPRPTVWRRLSDATVAAGARSAALAPDGGALVQVSLDRAQLVELPSGVPAWPAAVLPGSAEALVADGADAVVVGAGQLVRLPAEGPARPVGRYDGQLLRPAQVAAGRALLLVAVPRRLPLEVEQQAVLLDLADGRTLGWWPAGDPPRAALAPDGATVACPDLEGGLVLAGEPGTTTPLRPPGPTHAVRWVDGGRIVSAGQEGLEVWDVAASRRVVVEPAAGGAVVADLVVAAGLALVVRTGAPALVVPLAGGERPRTLAVTESARLGALAADGRWAVVADLEGARAFDLRSPQPVACGRFTLEPGDEVTSLAVVGPEAVLLGTARGGLWRLRLVPAE